MIQFNALVSPSQVRALHPCRDEKGRKRALRYNASLVRWLGVLLLCLWPALVHPYSGMLRQMIGYWSLEEASGTRADSTDFSGADCGSAAGTGCALTDNNTVTQAAGKVGNAADFEDGNSEQLSRADHADISTGDIDYSFAGWVYLDDVGISSRIVCKDDGSAQREFCLSKVAGSAGRFQWLVGNCAGSVAVKDSLTFGAPAAGQWYFFFVYHDAAKNQIGISINDGAVDTEPTSGPAADCTSTFHLGANSTPANFIDGRIDEVAFFKRRLTASEVTALYNGGAGRSHASLQRAATKRSMR